jgi:hypothetical protein
MRTVIYLQWIALVGLAVVVSLLFRGIESARTTSRQATCQSWVSFDAIAVSQIRASEKTATQLVYYKHHPDDLRRVIAADERFAKQLVPPSYC